MADTEAKKGPATKFKRGGVEAAIFENHKEGKTWHNVAIYRRYKNHEGQYREASTYAFDDLVQVARIAEEAEQWISGRLAELKTASSPNTGEGL